jgi:hypothetical protein
MDMHTRAARLRTRAEELAKFSRFLADLLDGAADEQLTQQAISLTKTDLNHVLRELVRIQQVRTAIKLDDLSPIRR